MSRKQRIVELTDEIERLKNELQQERKAYLDDAVASGIRSEDFGEWKFQIQKCKKLDYEETAVPGTFYKTTVDEKKVRAYLKENGRQNWGQLKDETRLIVKRIRVRSSARGL